MLLEFTYKTEIDIENKLMVVREKGGEGKITERVHAQTCPTLCSSMDCSPPGSSVREIVLARILERVAISSSQGIFLNQGLNKRPPMSPDGQVDSFTTEPLGKPIGSLKLTGTQCCI